MLMKLIFSFVPPPDPYVEKPNFALPLFAKISVSSCRDFSVGDIRFPRIKLHVNHAEMMMQITIIVVFIYISLMSAFKENEAIV